MSEIEELKRRVAALERVAPRCRREGCGTLVERADGLCPLHAEQEHRFLDEHREEGAHQGGWGHQRVYFEWMQVLVGKENPCGAPGDPHCTACARVWRHHEVGERRGDYCITHSYGRAGDEGLRAPGVKR
jgi:hypothetical protein